MSAERLWPGRTADQVLLGCGIKTLSITPCYGISVPVQVSSVLTALGGQHALPQFFWQRDDGDGDTEILKCPGCPRPATGQERGCGKQVAQAQDEIRSRIQRPGDPGKLKRVGQDLVALR